jgi:hypothetical protein
MTSRTRCQSLWIENNMYYYIIYYTQCPKIRAPEQKGEILIKRQIKILKEKNV